MITLSITTKETNAAQNAGTFARRYQQAMRACVRFSGMAQRINQQNFDISRYWGGRDYHDGTEQASREGRAA